MLFSLFSFVDLLFLKKMFRKKLNFATAFVFFKEQNVTVTGYITLESGIRIFWKSHLRPW